MWIFLSDAFLSVVAHREDPDILLVRSRVEGDIERAIPGAVVFTDDQADYRYRSHVTRKRLGEALAAQAEGLTATNFKGSVGDPVRHEAYTRVWGVMAAAYGAFGMYGGREAAYLDE